MKYAVIALFGITLSFGIVDSDETEEAARLMTGGEPRRGRELIERNGCGSCHTIPGIAGANALVGPSLDRIASRTYIAGVLENSPENMLRWVENPPGVDPLTAMPNLRLSPSDVRDVAAYLYTLR